MDGGALWIQLGTNDKTSLRLAKIQSQQHFSERDEKMISVPQFEKFFGFCVCWKSAFLEVYAMWFPWGVRIETCVNS